MRRRTFLTLSSTAAAAAVLGPRLARRSFAASFGEVPVSAASVMLPEETRATSVLEVFLYGGLSAWETLYLVADYGRPDDPLYPNQQFYTFGGNDSDSVKAALSACQFPDTAPVGEYFANDANGVPVELGPFAYRLRQRADITARMRLMVQRHALEPHEAAVPQALTGKPVGQPSAAGLGTHIQRYFADRRDPLRQAPESYVFAMGGFASDNVSAAAANGAHPGLARPLFVRLDNASRLLNLLARPGVSDMRPQYDQLMDVYIEQYRSRLRWRGQGEPVRSARFSELSHAATTVRNADSIAAVMSTSMLERRDGQACIDYNEIDIPGMSLAAARHLLTHPEQPARYVCVSDTGLYEASGGGGYDTHTNHSYDTARNFDNMMRSLLAIINEPGEADPTKLDLDRTLIILNTEFGRTPTRQEDGSGRNHHPYGYVTAFIGGPVTAAQRGIYGAIGPNGVASTHLTPAENRIAALLALGIWPFSPEAFAVSDVPGAGTEMHAARLVTERALGYVL